MDPHERNARLGQLGETMLAPDWLATEGFAVTNLNTARRNQPFGDLLLVRGHERYFTSVKTRNKNRDHGALNDSYNLTKFSRERVLALAAEHHAVPAWAALAVRADHRKFSGFFGLFSELANHGYIPMSVLACSRHHCFADDEFDARITQDLHNGRP